MKRFRMLLVTCLVTIGMTGCHSKSAGDAFRRIEGSIFGTHFRITYKGASGMAQVLDAVEKELAEIDRMASTWKSDSELMRYNRAKDRDAFELSEDLSNLLEISEQLRERTDGAFDIGFDGKQYDLSGIAKGYAVDRVTEILTEEFGISSCMVDIGGEVRVHGPGPKGDDWKVGIYVPNFPGEAGVKLPTVRLRDTSIATSGTTFKGEHLIDPETNKPARTGLLTVSVIDPSNTVADALATALFVMGPERGMAWAKEQKVHAIFVSVDGEVLRWVPGN